jgi:23S rRNA (cytosine1962-C5)-methyltransferase
VVDAEFIAGRLSRAVALRRALGLELGADGPTTAFRLVNAEADGLPGLVVDVYGRVLVVQATTLGAEAVLPLVVQALSEQTGAVAIVERRDSSSRELDGLRCQDPRVLTGELPEGETVEILENGHRFVVDLFRGHKTGFYLDQRENRRAFAECVQVHAGARDSYRVLNAFAYTGAFAVYACAAVPGARVTNLDASEQALDTAQCNADLNGFGERVDALPGNAFEELRRFRDSRQTFDAIVLDPPRFARGRSGVDRACRGYKDLNLLGLKLLEPGGLLFTFSCTGALGRDRFHEVVRDAVTDSGRSALILREVHHAGDHPVRPAFPEGEYLQGLILRVD